MNNRDKALYLERQRVRYRDIDGEGVKDESDRGGVGIFGHLLGSCDPLPERPEQGRG